MVLKNIVTKDHRDILPLTISRVRFKAFRYTARTFLIHVRKFSTEIPPIAKQAEKISNASPPSRMVICVMPDSVNVRMTLYIIGSCTRVEGACL